MPRDARRAQVLQIAQELFSGLGYHHVSMDDIADQAQVSKPVLYRHFPSKLDLYLAVVEMGGESLRAAVDEALAPVENGAAGPGDGRAVVHALVRAYFGFVQSAGESSSLLFESDVTRDADVRARVDRATEQAGRGIARVLTEYTGLPPEQNELLATALVGMAQTAATAQYRGTGAMSVDAATDLVARLAWAGVAGLVRPEEPGPAPAQS